MRFLIVLALALCAGAAAAQSPEGPQLPPPDTRVGVVHGQGRLGVYAVTHTFRYQGEYTVATNVARAGKSLLYLFADVDIQATQDNTRQAFRPQRLVGTFEGGARQLFGVLPLSVFARHQSAHYIDRVDLLMGSWDMAGVRWQQPVGQTQLSVSLAKYLTTHQTASRYGADFDVQGITPLGTVRGHRLELRSDLHAASGSGGRGGFADYWIEPSLFLTEQTAVFVGGGQVHDTNVSAANTDHPVMAGVRLVY